MAAAKQSLLLLLLAILSTCALSNPTAVEDPQANEIDGPPLDGKSNAFVPQMLSYVFDVLNIKGVVKDVKLGKTTPGTCAACKFGVSMLRSFLETGKTEAEIARTAIAVCKTLNLFTERVCEGAVGLFKDQVIYVLGQVVLSSDEICGILLGNSCADVVNPLHNWTIALPDTPKPPVTPVLPPKAGYPVLKILQITDIHYDPFYVEGNEADCKEPLCCRLADGPAKTPATRAGKFGDYRDCDSSMTTLESLLDHVVSKHKIDIVLWTGDVPPHDIWNSSRLENTHIIQTVTEVIKSKFKNTPVYPSVGNHETVPVNSFPPPEVTGKFGISWLYDALVESWGPWLTKDAEKTLRKGGFYSIKVLPGFRIISINSNYCNSLNWWLLLNSTDPAQQLEWLANELQKAEDQGEKVHIISHIPPGKYDCMKSWSENFNRIINRYEGTVRSQYYGHTHQDEFEVFYDDPSRKDRRATNVAYITPSVTTYGGVNPSFRIFTVDGNYPESSFAVLDHETFYLNLTEANLGRPSWERAYSAKETYGMESLQPSDWDALIRRFEEDDPLFQTFYRLFNMLSDAFDGQECVGGCRDDLLCKLKSSRSNDPALCEV